MINYCLALDSRDLGVENAKFMAKVDNLGIESGVTSSFLGHLLGQGVCEIRGEDVPSRLQLIDLLVLHVSYMLLLKSC